MLCCREIPQVATTTDIPSRKAGIGKDVPKHLSNLIYCCRFYAYHNIFLAFADSRFYHRQCYLIN